VKLYDVIYENKNIKEAKIRKMKVQDRMRLRREDSKAELVFEVYDSTKHNDNVFVTYTKNAIKETSTSDLYRAIPKKDS
jgi:hypothetical protein